MPGLYCSPLPIGAQQWTWSGPEHSHSDLIRCEGNELAVTYVLSVIPMTGLMHSAGKQETGLDVQSATYRRHAHTRDIEDRYLIFCTFWSAAWCCVCSGIRG